MTLEQTIADYNKLGEFFSPDYGRENEVLSAYKSEHGSLSDMQVNTLIDILNSKDDWTEKFFVADLLYLYPDFPVALVDPMLYCAVTYQDPSFDRIFLRPCMNRIGTRTVVDKLISYLETGTMKERMGVTLLSYWIRGDESSRTALNAAMMTLASKTTNPVELYHYKLRLDGTIPLFSSIPNDAQGLKDLVKGKPDLEGILFDQLGWK